MGFGFFSGWSWEIRGRRNSSGVRADASCDPSPSSSVVALIFHGPRMKEPLALSLLAGVSVRRLLERCFVGGPGMTCSYRQMTWLIGSGNGTYHQRHTGAHLFLLQEREIVCDSVTFTRRLSQVSTVRFQNGVGWGGGWGHGGCCSRRRGSVVGDGSVPRLRWWSYRSEHAKNHLIVHVQRVNPL